MKTNLKVSHWHGAKAGNDYQGLIYEEATGKNIAVAYDNKDTALIAAAPELYKALQDMVEYFNSLEAIPCISKAIKVVGHAMSVIASIEEGTNGGSEMAKIDMTNLPVRKVSIECIEHPEWGTFGIYSDKGDYYEIHGEGGHRVLFKDEAQKFWREREMK